MNRELKCPHCGSVFTVDEADYAAILNQVRNEEFEQELGRRLAELERTHKAEQQTDRLRTEQAFQNEINKKTQELTTLRADKEKELTTLRMQKEQELNNLRAQKEQEIAALKAAIAQSGDKQQIAVMEVRQKAANVLKDRDQQILQLQNQITTAQNEAALNEVHIRQGYEQKLTLLKEQVDYYKEMKLRLSTKMIGESLEQHCNAEYNKNLRPVMPGAYFEKDNDASEGSKGDFIFRDYADGEEYVSIMFEMKNEADATATKHKNEDFFKKLDEDRRKKGCEYAVLVTLLEPDSELYNGGIVDVSYRYEKMYVIRPQFFIPLITLLVQTSKKTIDYQRQLAIAKSQSIDVTNFENKLNEFKDGFARNYDLASRKFHTAIEEIDKTIDHLQKVRQALVGSEDNLRLANNKAEGLTIKKLTYGNPTMKQKFDEARAAEDDKE